jgi:hypothetical protein
MESSTRAANKIDPLELSIAPHVPTINLNLNLSVAPPDVNQLPPNTWSAKPFVRPLRKYCCYTFSSSTRCDYRSCHLMSEYS